MDKRIQQNTVIETKQVNYKRSI
uniref:Uncharacterized protein n=1 Tax=Anguilla anguilla TaxID=7936 RepID=A0A0E9WCV8_ANGAN